ncbi:hypothetical protein OSTOST_09347 [Ostertagia ostertagi]
MHSYILFLRTYLTVFFRSSFVLLLSSGHAEGYNCEENVPEKIQVFLANAINSKRKEYNSAVNLLLGHVEFDCNLAREAFTHEYKGKVHDGFHSLVERNLEETITETLEKAIGNVHKNEIWFGTAQATKVGCSIKLITKKENGQHWLLLQCKFSTVRGNPRK